MVTSFAICILIREGGNYSSRMKRTPTAVSLSAFQRASVRDKGGIGTGFEAEVIYLHSNFLLY